MGELPIGQLYRGVMLGLGSGASFPTGKVEWSHLGAGLALHDREKISPGFNGRACRMWTQHRVPGTPPGQPVPTAFCRSGRSHCRRPRTFALVYSSLALLCDPERRGAMNRSMRCVLRCGQTQERGGRHQEARGVSAPPRPWVWFTPIASPALQGGWQQHAWISLLFPYLTYSSHQAACR